MVYALLGGLVTKTICHLYERNKLILQIEPRFGILRT